jgi:hypothetical protein
MLKNADASRDREVQSTMPTHKTGRNTPDHILEGMNVKVSRRDILEEILVTGYLTDTQILSKFPRRGEGVAWISHMKWGKTRKLKPVVRNGERVYILTPLGVKAIGVRS